MKDKYYSYFLKSIFCDCGVFIATIYKPDLLDAPRDFQCGVLWCQKRFSIALSPEQKTDLRLKIKKLEHIENLEYLIRQTRAELEQMK